MFNSFSLRRYHLLVLLFALPFCLMGQKKMLDYEAIAQWRKIAQQKISPDGQWVAYTLQPTTEGDAELLLWNAGKEKAQSFQRSSQAVFTADGRFLVFLTKPPLDTLKAQRRKKVKDDDLPGDTLMVYRLSDGHTEKIGDVRSFSVPEKWSGMVACTLNADHQEPKKGTAAKDSTATTGRQKRRERKWIQTGVAALV
ncbi:MAG: hypothetical protein IPL65_05230 [Lewinellaceae bacterium]|nr:hypothetical protein [Lewinellaceae bacterium]